MKTVTYKTLEALENDFPGVWDTMKSYYDDERSGVEGDFDKLLFKKVNSFYSKFADANMIHIHCDDETDENVVFEVFAFDGSLGMEVQQHEVFDTNETTAEIHEYFTHESYM